MPTTLILTMVGLLFLLIALVFAYVWSARSRKKIPETIEGIETFDSLRAVLLNPASSTDQLRDASERITAHFGTVTPQTLHAYQQLIETLCTHPHTDSKLILKFEKSLRGANPRFTHEIEHALTLGLAKRG